MTMYGGSKIERIIIKVIHINTPENELDLTLSATENKQRQKRLENSGCKEGCWTDDTAAAEFENAPPMAHLESNHRARPIFKREIFDISINDHNLSGDQNQDKGIYLIPHSQSILKTKIYVHRELPATKKSHCSNDWKVQTMMKNLDR